MTVYFLLLAGLTSFMSKRCFVHFFSRGPDGDVGSSQVILTNPVSTATGIEMLPITTMAVKRVAKADRRAFQRGWLAPRVWSMLQIPCRRWSPRASMARM
jgi:hypothetical protein